jgi:hypothetical protein
MKELQDYWKSGDYHQVELDLFWQRCLARYQIKMNNENFNFSSVNGRDYTHDLREGTFAIFAGALNFIYYYGISGHYLSTGRCSPVK